MARSGRDTNRVGIPARDTIAGTFGNTPHPAPDSDFAVKDVPSMAASTSNRSRIAELTCYIVTNVHVHGRERFLSQRLRVRDSKSGASLYRLTPTELQTAFKDSNMQLSLTTSDYALHTAERLLAKYTHTVGISAGPPVLRRRR